MAGWASPSPCDLGTLDEGLLRLGLASRDRLRERILVYLAELERWNRRFNLVSRPSQAEILTRHVFDCLSVTRFVRGPHLVDVGTGAGLPGLMLAAASTDVHCVLVDSNAKKTRFCLHAAGSMGLNNVEVIHSRVESFGADRSFSTIVARGFSSTHDLVERARHLAAPRGRILAMKGPAAKGDLDGLASMGDNVEVVPLEVPGLHAGRSLVIVRVSATGGGPSPARSAPAADR